MGSSSVNLLAIPPTETKMFSLSRKTKRERTRNGRAEILSVARCGLSKQGTIDVPSELQHIQQVIGRQSSLSHYVPSRKGKATHFDAHYLAQAYESCRKICAHNSTTYYLGSLLMTEERKKAIWAIYAWGHRLDELVDGSNAEPSSSSTVLERWEERLEDIFNGHPHDIVDAALVDTLRRFPLDIQLFRDVIKGMKVDTWKTRYQNFEELEIYSYYASGTMALMIVPILGFSSEDSSSTSTESFYKAALSSGTASQLTNILRDVAEDASRGRIYLPQDELREFGLTDEDIFSRRVTDKWREFMKKQITRARFYYDQAQEVASQLDSASRWPVWASLLLYRKILDEIERNNYDNLTKQARVGMATKFLTLPVAYAKAMGL